MDKTILHWSYHNLKHIPESLLDYGAVEEVYLKENFIECIPKWLLHLVKLKFIHLLGNHIREIPENIYYLENLEFLDLSHNKLTALPESIGKLVNLKRFSVGGNEIRSIPKAIGDLMNLEYLDISANLFRQLPVDLGRLKELREIILSDNHQLKTIPNGIFMLPKLNSILADRCGLLYLPAVLSPSVTHVRLFNNHFISHIPIVYLNHIQRFYDIIYFSDDSYYNPSEHFEICEEGTLRKLRIPFDVRRVHFIEQRIPLSLFELCLKSLGDNNFTYRFNKMKQSIPDSLVQIIESGPSAICSNNDCQQLLYSEYYFLIVKRHSSSSKLIFSCSFCSMDCLDKWKELNKTEYCSVKCKHIDDNKLIL